MTTALAFAALVALVAFAFFLMWGMPRIYRGRDEDSGPAVGGGADGGGGTWGHHHGSGNADGGHGDGGGHGGGGGDSGGGHS